MTVNLSTCYSSLPRDSLPVEIACQLNFLSQRAFIIQSAIRRVGEYIFLRLGQVSGPVTAWMSGGALCQVRMQKLAEFPEEAVCHGSP